jgi:hexosaminidase
VAPRPLPPGEPAQRAATTTPQPSHTIIPAPVQAEVSTTRSMVLDTTAVIVAPRPAGLFYGVQTLRQLLPPEVENSSTPRRPWRVPLAHVEDRPRYPWRGAMLDVARHFRPSADVERYIDLMALHKLSRLHLHLSDDQGWRIEVPSWPRLALQGGRTQVGGGEGGYYTREQYAGIVRYAAERFVTVVPEIDMPAHTNAALEAYPELACATAPPRVRTDIEVGYSFLCVQRDSVYRFADAVVGSIAKLTPGPYFHVGGDEVHRLTHAQYIAFVERVQEIVRAHHKHMIGWSEIAPARLDPGTIVQHWIPDSAALHIARGGKVILSPATKTYIDMKYDSTTTLGLDWAALIEVRDAYDWEPSTWLKDVPPEAILGVEAPLWSETISSMQDVEYLAFPRLAALAEVAWSQPDQRSWEEFRLRLGAQAPRWNGLGLHFYRSPQVPWQDR